MSATTPETSPLDIAVRQQGYVEGVKNGEDDKFDDTAELLAALLALLLARYKYERVADMPKRVLAKFTADFNKTAGRYLVAFRKRYLSSLAYFGRINRNVTKLIYENISGRTVGVPDNASLWTTVENALVPATGVTIGVMVLDFTRAVTTNINRLIARAHTEGWTIQVLLQELNGTNAARGNDGLIARLRRQFSTMQHTLTQHVHGAISFHVGRLFYERYQWISVLDSQTTDICRSRANRIYSYADGPRPPAHYRCRSSIVGIAESRRLSHPASIVEWLLSQPDPVVTDLLGAGRARLLRAGELNATNTPRLSGTPAITIDQYQQRLARMLS